MASSALSATVFASFCCFPRRILSIRSRAPAQRRSSFRSVTKMVPSSTKKPKWPAVLRSTEASRSSMFFQEARTRPSRTSRTSRYAMLSPISTRTLPGSRGYPPGCGPGTPSRQANSGSLSRLRCPRSHRAPSARCPRCAQPPPSPPSKSGARSGVANCPPGPAPVRFSQ